MLDKCRATLAGQNGEYHFNCPIDQYFLSFTGIDPEALKAEVAKGLGDGEVLDWIQANTKRIPSEIAQWSSFMESAPPSTNDARAFISETIAAAGGGSRRDIGTWFDFLDLDDHITFGGKA
jgi:hypothetical protein